MTVYFQLGQNDFVNWDDPVFIRDNPHIRTFSRDHLSWMWTTFYQGNWTPLSWLSLAVNDRFFGPEPWSFHMGNLLLHLFNTLLVFLLSRKILGLTNGTGFQGPESGQNTLAASSLTALIFGIHPFHVEPVAWATDRLDLLCAFFYFLSLSFYLDFMAGNRRRWRSYLAALGFFLLALMSKSMAVTLPVVLLVLDVWPLSRHREGGLKWLLEKIPFLLGSLALGTVTIIARSQSGALAGMDVISWDFRWMNAFHSIFFYLWKSFFPAPLAALYPIRLKDALGVSHLLSVFLFVALGLLLFSLRIKKPFLLTAWFIYLVTLGPTLGLLHVGSQAAADRYFYLPSFAPFLIFSAAWITYGIGKKLWFFPATLALVLLWGGMGYQQVRTWRNSVSLWTHTVQSLPRNSTMAFTLLADALREEKNWDESLRIADYALQLDPSFFYLRNIKGAIALEQGKLVEARDEFSASMGLDPHRAWPHAHLGIILSRLGEKDKATAEFQTALGLEKDDAVLHFQLGTACFQWGLYPEASRETETALEAEPPFAEARCQWGRALERMGQFERAVEGFKGALSLEPFNPEYQWRLGYAYLHSRQPQKALTEFRKLGD